MQTPNFERSTSNTEMNLGQLEVLQAVLAEGRAFRMTALGNSMYPAIRSGDVLTVEPLDNRTPQPGRVVAFVHPETGRLIIHRVLTAAGDGWRLRGDNCPMDDGIVTREAMLGVVARVERNGRDIRCGVKWGGTLIAYLNRGQALRRVRWLSSLPRRSARRALRCLCRALRHTRFL